MKYIYYPGCSLEGTAKEYDQATRILLKAMGVELLELDDWTCCGASAADGVSRILSQVLPARNLALAEQMDGGLDILVPCSACYLNLKRVEVIGRTQPEALKQINMVLAEEQLAVTGKVAVRHLLDVLAREIGAAAVAEKVTRRLQGMTIAPYYGCQCLRPYALFDDPEEPNSMDDLIKATGAQVLNWSMGPKCCGASHMSTKMDVGLALCGAILQAGQKADAIVTVCPMCQMNLEAYQKKISRLKGEALDLTILYLPQLLGLALGYSGETLQVDLNLSVTDAFQAKLSGL